MTDRTCRDDRFKGVVCFAAVDWRFLKQRVHHLMTAFAGIGLKTLFIENTGVRAPRLGDAVRIKQRLVNAVSNRSKTKWGQDILPENLDVYAPLALPFPYQQAAAWYNKWLFERKINDFLAQNKLTPGEVVLWTYLATPAVLETVFSIPWGRVVYDVVADPKEVEQQIGRYEHELLQRADLVLFASATLEELYGSLTRNPVLFRDGFNTELSEIDYQVHPEIAVLPRPRFIYIGGINRKFWTEALNTLARAFPDASIILVGPIASDEVKLPVAANVHLFPSCRRYEDLAGFLHAADIALIPYRPDQYAGAMHPAKLNEYLVFGLPVVATATPELSRLAAEWPEKTLYLANTPEEFSRVAVQAVLEDRPEIRERRRLVTRNKNWQSRVDDLKRIL